MGEIAKYLKLKDIIYSYMDEAIQNTSVFRRLWTLAIRGLQDLSMDVFPNIKTCKVCIDGNMTAQLPEDYINWSKVGVLNMQGEVATLKLNNNLTLYADTSVDRLLLNTDSIGGGLAFGNLANLFYLNYYDGSYGYGLTNLYGISGNEATKIGEFKIDEEHGIIIVDNQYPTDYIILEYLAAPSCDDDYKVPIQGQEALIAWLSWHDISQLAASRKVSVYDKTARRREYYNQKRLARERLKPIRIQDIYNITQDAIRLVPKG
jgi:hypothetical protein